MPDNAPPPPPDAATDIAPEVRLGRWGPVLNFANAPIHTHVLPDGRALF